MTLLQELLKSFSEMNVARGDGTGGKVLFLSFWDFSVSIANAFALQSIYGDRFADENLYVTFLCHNKTWP